MKINSISGLRLAIKELETKSSFQKKQITFQIEQLKPVHLFKDTFNQLKNSSHFQNKILNGIIGILTGILSKKILIGKPNSLIKKIGGIILELGVARIIIKNASKIKSVGRTIFKNIFKYRNLS